MAVYAARRGVGAPRAPARPGAAGGGKAIMSPEENKALVRRWFAETDKGNLAIIDELLPPEYLDHNPPIPGLPRGREGSGRPTCWPAPPSRTPSTSSRSRWPRGTR